MNLNEKEYRSIANWAGWCLLIFIVLFNASTIAVSLLSSVSENVLSYDINYSFISILQIIAYLSSFIVPAIILRAILKRKGVLQPMRLEFRLPKSSWLLIPSATAMGFCASYVNSLLLSVFELNDTYTEMVMGTTYPLEPYEMLLALVSTAIVPAVCEEFLFRGTILSNFMPFGRGNAIVISSVLFGLMHQNPYQILYTTVAGLVLGYAYVKTGSIWCPTLIHFFNNAVAVVEEIVIANFKNEATAMIVVSVIELFVVLVGAICFVAYLIIDSKCQKKKYEKGSFGIVLEESDGYEEKILPANVRLKKLFAPGMIVFFIVALISIVSLIAVLMMVKGMELIV